jgi:hypothetical protein
LKYEINFISRVLWTAVRCAYLNGTSDDTPKHSRSEIYLIARNIHRIYKFQSLFTKQRETRSNVRVKLVSTSRIKSVFCPVQRKNIFHRHQVYLDGSLLSLNRNKSNLGPKEIHETETYLHSYIISHFNKIMRALLCHKCYSTRVISKVSNL